MLSIGGKLELATIAGGKLTRAPVGSSGTSVGIVVDRAGRTTLALADGRILTRAGAAWTTVTVTEVAPASHPGSPPAHSQ